MAILNKTLATRMEWLWPGWIPWGKYTLVVGTGGVAKSQLMYDMIARLSTNRPMIDGTIVPNAVFPIIYLSNEDEIGPDLVPRLIAAGTNFDHGNIDAEAADWTFPRDLAKLFARMKEVPPTNTSGLLVIDPADEYMDDRLSPNHAPDVGLFLRKIKEAAQKSGWAIVLVYHENKSKAEGSSATDRVAGSRKWITKSRNVITVMHYDTEGRYAYVARMKGNIKQSASYSPMVLEKTLVPYHSFPDLVSISDPNDLVIVLEFANFTNEMPDEIKQGQEAERKERADDTRTKVKDLAGSIQAEFNGKRVAKSDLDARFPSSGRSAMDRALRKIGAVLKRNIDPLDGRKVYYDVPKSQPQTRTSVAAKSVLDDALAGHSGNGKQSAHYTDF